MGDRDLARRPNIELRHLRAFVVAAEELHFTRAASRLHLCQQGLSAQIRHLEHELGVTLFRRTTRKVELTEAGETFREQAAEILQAVDDAVADARRTAPADQDVITIGYTPTVSGDVLSSVLERAHETLPHIRVALCETWTPETVSGVAEGRFDVAISRCPVLPADFAATEVRREPIGIVLAESHALAAEEWIPVEALDGLVLSIWERRLSPTFFDAIMRAFPAHTEQSRHFEMEQFGHETFYGDPMSRREILAGRAFYATFEDHYESLPPGFVWRPVRPATLIGCVLFHRAANDRRAVHDLVAVAHAVASERGWLDPAEQPAA